MGYLTIVVSPAVFVGAEQCMIRTSWGLARHMHDAHRQNVPSELGHAQTLPHPLVHAKPAS
jgi:hypothetical protein